MTERNFRRALQEADRELAELSPSVETQLRIRAMGDGKAVRARPLMLRAAPLLAALALALVWWWRAPETIGDYRLQSCSAARPKVEGDRVELGGPCQLTDERLGARLQSVGPVRFERREHGLAVMQGQLLLEVDPARPRAAPFEVVVSGGTIRVLGTRFSVVEHGDRGRVVLEHGKIAFLANDGRQVELTPGGSLEWPLPRAPIGVAQDQQPLLPTTSTASNAPAAQPPAASKPASKPVGNPVGRSPAVRPRPLEAPQAPTPPAEPAPPAGFSAEAFLEELAALRSRGQYEQAVARIESMLGDRRLLDSTRARLSFERGSILSHQLHDRARACAAWDRHQQDYGLGSYREEIARARQSLGCKGEGP